MFKHLFLLKPRANRMEFVFWAFLFQLISYVYIFVPNQLAQFANQITPGLAVLILLCSLLLMPVSFMITWWYLALLVRRLHDLNLSGWWLLVTIGLVIGNLLFPFFLPISWFVGGSIMLFLMFKTGIDGDNKYGPIAKQYYPKFMNRTAVFYIVATIFILVMIGAQINSFKNLQHYQQIKTVQMEHF